jgi:hypothetical protein
MAFDVKNGPPGPGTENARSLGTHTQASTQLLADHQIGQAQLITASQQVAWLPVHDYINRERRRTGANEFSAPTLGTPLWCVLADGHPAKLSAVLNLAEAVAYSIAHMQVAEAEASQAISGSADWTTIARAVRQRTEFGTEKPWARRVVA